MFFDKLFSIASESQFETLISSRTACSELKFNICISKWLPFIERWSFTDRFFIFHFNVSLCHMWKCNTYEIKFIDHSYVENWNNHTICLIVYHWSDTLHQLSIDCCIRQRNSRNSIWLRIQQDIWILPNIVHNYHMGFWCLLLLHHMLHQSLARCRKRISVLKIERSIRM